MRRTRGSGTGTFGIGPLPLTMKEAMPLPSSD